MTIACWVAASSHSQIDDIDTTAEPSTIDRTEAEAPINTVDFFIVDFDFLSLMHLLMAITQVQNTCSWLCYYSSTEHMLMAITRVLNSCT